MTAPASERGVLVPERRPADGRGALVAALERVRAWWAGPAPERLAFVWEAAADATASFRPGPSGLFLTCRTGTFVVTQEGDPEDHVLAPGDRLRTAARGRVAAWALEPGAVAVEGARRL